jgi:hypothetical protein
MKLLIIKAGGTYSYHWALKGQNVLIVLGAMYTLANRSLQDFFHSFSISDVVLLNIQFWTGITDCL